jgi:diguanylate cyclase (GGDEF)-like protein
MWLDMAIAMSCASGGLVCGWIMHAMGGVPIQAPERQSNSGSSSNSKKSVEAEPTQEQITQVAESLRAYAGGMAADVDAHQTKVQAVNNSLIAGDDTSPEAVLKAVNELIQANQIMQTQLQTAQDRIHEQSAQIESAERRAFTDALTRIPNRGAFDAHIKKRLRLGADRPTTMVLFDVDHFKKFNDVYGHIAGDEVLRCVATSMNAKLQSYGLVARYGGEEFAVIFDDCTAEDALSAVEAARSSIGEREIEFEDKRLRVTASCGVAQLADGETLEEWIQRADVGLYQSKEAGRDCGHWMDGESAIPIKNARTGPRGPAKPKDSEAKKAMMAALSGADASAPVPSLGDAAQDKPEEEDLGAFSDLPSFDSMSEEFTEIRDRTQSNVAVFMMAIRSNTSESEATMRSLLQIVRATLRSVDRIGCSDASTLLICMPSVDDATARQRGDQICRSALSIGFKPNDECEHPITVGITQAKESEDFGNVVSRAALLADEGQSGENGPVCFDEVAASA